jgi:hypothetical protein
MIEKMIRLIFILVFILTIGFNAACISYVYGQMPDELLVKIDVDLTPALKTDLNKIRLIAHTDSPDVNFSWRKTGPGEFFESDSAEVYYLLPNKITQQQVKFVAIVTTTDKKRQGIKEIVLTVSELFAQINQKRQTVAATLREAERERKNAEALKIKKAQAERERKNAEALKIKKAQAERERKNAKALKIKKAQAERKRKAAEALKIKKAREEQNRLKQEPKPKPKPTLRPKSKIPDSGLQLLEKSLL